MQSGRGGGAAGEACVERGGETTGDLGALLSIKDETNLGIHCLDFLASLIETVTGNVAVMKAIYSADLLGTGP